MEVLEKMLTYREYREMEFDDDDNFQYELIDGELSQKPFLTIIHQRISGNIMYSFTKFLYQNPLGEVLLGPLDVVLNEYNAPQPDIIFVSNANKHMLNETEQVVIGIPDLIIEILSLGSIKRDRITKRKVYERCGVPEFWVIDPSYKSVEIFRLADGAYELADFIEQTGLVKSTVLEGFELPLDKIF